MINKENIVQSMNKEWLIGVRFKARHGTHSIIRGRKSRRRTHTSSPSFSLSLTHSLSPSFSFLKWVQWICENWRNRRQGCLMWQENKLAERAHKTMTIQRRIIASLSFLERCWNIIGLHSLQKVGFSAHQKKSSYLGNLH